MARIALVVAAAVLAAAALAACSGSGGLCPDLDGADFRSAENISAILGPEGVEPAPEYLEFSGDEVYWYYGDIVESGEWSCRDNRVTAFEGRLEGDLVEEDSAMVLLVRGNRFVLDS